MSVEAVLSRISEIRSQIDTLRGGTATAAPSTSATSGTAGSSAFADALATADLDGTLARAADTGALVDLVVRLAALAEDFPQVAELDLNPVIALADECVAVDARVRVAHAAPPGRLKSW